MRKCCSMRSGYQVGCYQACRHGYFNSCCNTVPALLVRRQRILVVTKTSLESVLPIYLYGHPLKFRIYTHFTTYIVESLELRVLHQGFGVTQCYIAEGRRGLMISKAAFIPTT